ITPATTFAAFGGRAAIHAEWSAVPAAATYRVAIEDAGGEPVVALAIAAPATRFDAADLAPGAYRVTVAAIDGDGFESAPSPPLPFVSLPSATTATPSLARGAVVTVAVPVYRDDATSDPEVAASRGLRVVSSSLHGDQLMVELEVAPDAPARGRVVATAAGGVV